MAKMGSVDETDRRLADALRRDGRASYEDLGRAAGVSRTMARTRVGRMLETGVVRVEAIVHPAVEGTRAMAHVSSVTADGAEPDVAASLAELDECPFVSIVAGRYGVIAEIRTPGLARLEEHLDRLRAHPGVTEIDTVLYTDIVKDPYLTLGRPEDFRPADLDEADRELVRLLAHDPRASYAELSARLGLSPGPTRTRLGRLMSTGVVAVTGLVSPAGATARSMCGFALHLDGGSDTIRKAAAVPGVDFLARTIGRCDALGTVIADGGAAVRAALSEMSSLAGVRRVEAWWHLELVKERYPTLSGDESAEHRAWSD
jgi:DNA-binding Lrp family transcriptional regulator